MQDAAGRVDETVPLLFDRTDGRLPDPELSGPVIAAGEGEDRAARRGIPVRGGAVTVSGEGVPEGASITVLGEPVPIDPSGALVVSRILPPGEHGVRVGVARPGGQAREIERGVTIPRSEWFATGLVDVTIGRDLADDEGFGYGRIAGYADGTLADGTRITASVDTGEDELDELFGTFDRRSPEGVLDEIDPRDVFVTFGDDSVLEDLAPSSDGLYLRVEQGLNSLAYGDFEESEGPRLTVRSDRTLTGLQGSYRSMAVTPDGEPRVRGTAYAAEPDTLAQRDRFRGTGGSA